MSPHHPPSTSHQHRRRNRVGIFTPASPIGMVELEMGVAVMRDAGFEVAVHDQASAQHFIFAGTDAQRVGALWDLATDDAIEVVWCARGGYGCTHLLPLLDRLTAEHGPPAKKLLVGYSDVTVLHHYVRARWGWDTLHANMPASASFVAMDESQRDATFALVKDGKPTESGRVFGGATLDFFANAPAGPIEGEVLGGNLATWNYLTGTPWAPTPEEIAGRFLFFEDLGEGFYKMDAYLTQLDQAGGLDGIAGLILGGFHDCTDEQATRLASPPTDAQADPPMVPLRPTYDERESMSRITAPLAAKHGFPVAWKLPVSHGPDYGPLMLGAKHELTPEGWFVLGG
ncbi:MAG: LD-carboxypeptidase [Planctomycetota bacterium]